MIAAAMKHYKIKPEDVEDRLIVKARGEVIISFAEYERGGSVTVNEAFIRDLISKCNDHEVDVLMIDPLIKFHGVSEVDPVAMRKVLDALASVAQNGNCGDRLAHHTRKGNGGEVTVESMRGTQAIIYAVRNVELLEVMPKTAADDLKLENHNDYFRSFSGRAAYSPKLSESTWYKREVVLLDNGGPLFGDEVAVVTPWAHPGKGKPVMLTAGTISAIVKRVGKDPVWREHYLAEMWVGKAVAEELQLDPAKDKRTILKAIADMKADGALRSIPGQTEKRETRLFVVAGDRSPEQVFAQAVSPGHDENYKSA